MNLKRVIRLAGMRPEPRLPTGTLFSPLVATPMIAPTRAYDGLPALSAAEAADWMVTAARTRPIRVAPRITVAYRALDVMAPRLVNGMMLRQTPRAAS